MALLSHPALAGTCPFGGNRFVLSFTIFEGEVFNWITIQHTIYAVNRTTNFATSDVCDYFAPGRGQNDADREVSSVRRGGAARRLGHGAEKSARYHLRLDGTRAPEGHFCQLDGPSIRISRILRQPAGYAGSQRFFGRHISCADGG